MLLCVHCSSTNDDLVWSIYRSSCILSEYNSVYEVKCCFGRNFIWRLIHDVVGSTAICLVYALSDCCHIKS